MKQAKKQNQEDAKMEIKEIITDNFFGNANFIFDGIYPVGFGCAEGLSRRKIDSLKDSLYDAAGITIATGTDGYTYGIELYWDGSHMVPGVWQRCNPDFK